MKKLKWYLVLAFVCVIAVALALKFILWALQLFAIAVLVVGAIMVAEFFIVRAKVRRGIEDERQAEKKK